MIMEKFGRDGRGGRWRSLLALIVLTVSLLGPALAVQPDEILPDATLESRARGLSKELRCMVCQNQSIDDSDAPLAILLIGAVVVVFTLRRRRTPDSVPAAAALTPEEERRLDRLVERKFSPSCMGFRHCRRTWPDTSY